MKNSKFWEKKVSRISILGMTDGDTEAVVEVMVAAVAEDTAAEVRPAVVTDRTEGGKFFFRDSA